ncbi:hypothetical protein [Mesobacillus zeae]|uniref:Uncharacterized protein n=1 Tax=Mesobacillus zeae TaxID=1917180 RepID=A0A398BBG5_9BACI|nr:hypothetical protein [Mesobacillus zeae]RID87509.1 hypothetical protein D1970_04890 [Mesobacillus zeae]
MKKNINYLDIITIFLLCIISLAGILSMDFSKSYDATNQYGDIVKMFGNGIYAHDSYFKAPISIGSDICILFVLVPLFIYTSVKNMRADTNITKVQLVSVYAVALYYAASISFGVTYNLFHLLYIALFSCSLFGMFSTIRKIKINKLNFEITLGIKIFLVLTGIALIVAWMPDIIPSIIEGRTLSLIEVYTTEITYVLDMGIIGPLCLVCLYLLNKKDNLGTLILAILFKVCMIVGVMMISQTICQSLSGYEITLPVLICKSGSFSVLGVFALYFNTKLYRRLRG